MGMGIRDRGRGVRAPDGLDTVVRRRNAVQKLAPTGEENTTEVVALRGNDGANPCGREGGAIPGWP